MTRSLFDPVVPEAKMNRRFRDVRDTRAFAAARQLMDEVFADFPDVDHNFVREFQTGGFTPRVLELAVFAYLKEQGYDLDRTSPTPDFVVTGDAPMAIEVTTSNPPEDADPDDVDPSVGLRRLVPDDLPAAGREFVFQAGKTLRRKLLKRDAAGRAYWEQPHTSGVPFVIALETFHNASALSNPVGLLAEYLYGRRDVATYDADGNLELTAETISDHQHEGKIIASGLFSLPEAAHLAGVLFTNNATVSKFNRIGTERGYGASDVAMIRFGTMPDPDPNAVEPQMFCYPVGDEEAGYQETFSEGLQLMHNPWAKNPLELRALRGITEHQMLDDGRVLTTSSRLDPFASVTQIFQGAHAEEYARQALAVLLTDDSSDTTR